MAMLRVPGPVTVHWNDTDIGCSSQGINIRPRSAWVPVVDDCHGADPATFIFAGKSCVIELIAHDTDKVKAAALFHGQLLALTNIGTLASSIADTLEIWERNSSTSGDPDWVAPLTVPVDPTEIGFTTTRELVWPIVWLVLPNSDGKLFTSVPSYIAPGEA